MCCVLDIIIVGNGKMGFSLADQLASEDHSITIVDTHEAALRRASDTLDVMSVKGNGVSAAVLREAGAEHADLLIAATSTDEVNMVCCLTAKKMGTSYTIARIRNQEYTSGLAELKRDLGIDMVINPENATAVEISRLLRFPSAANIETFCRGRVELMGFRLMEEDFLVGNPLQDLSSQVKKLSLLFCAVDRDGEVIIPNGSFVPQAGDNLYLIGRPTGLDQFFRLLGWVAAHGGHAVGVIDMRVPLGARQKRNGADAVHEKRRQAVLGDHEDKGDDQQHHDGDAGSRHRFAGKVDAALFAELAPATLNGGVLCG